MGLGFTIHTKIKDIEKFQQLSPVIMQSTMNHLRRLVFADWATCS